MDLNELAKSITLMEGMKKQNSIAQVKEILRCLRDFILLKTNIDLYWIFRAIKDD